MVEPKEAFAGFDIAISNVSSASSRESSVIVNKKVCVKVDGGNSKVPLAAS